MFKEWQGRPGLNNTCGVGKGILGGITENRAHCWGSRMWARFQSPPPPASTPVQGTTCPGICSGSEALQEGQGGGAEWVEDGV